MVEDRLVAGNVRLLGPGMLCDLFVTETLLSTYLQSQDVAVEIM